MPATVHVETPAKLQHIARELKTLGDKELRRELYRGINRSVKPLTADVKREMPQHLPNAYAVELARTLRVRTRTRTGKNPAIFLVGRSKTKRGKQRDLASLNRGRLRHPLFGNRRHWYNQAVRPDWWTHPLVQGVDQVRNDIEQVLDGLARKLNR